MLNLLNFSAQLAAETSFRKPFIFKSWLVVLAPWMFLCCNILQGWSSILTHCPSHCPDQSPWFHPTWGRQVGEEDTSPCCQILLLLCCWESCLLKLIYSRAIQYLGPVYSETPSEVFNKQNPQNQRVFLMKFLLEVLQDRYLSYVNSWRLFTTALPLL